MIIVATRRDDKQARYFLQGNPGVQHLFTMPEVALAGWLHYLAFDLWVGLWIARHADALGISRWLQAPVLFATFMFGPIGLLLYAPLARRNSLLERWISAVAAPDLNTSPGGRHP